MVRARGTARDRVVKVAVELFAEHGVQGTSLQMIADRIGVGKAAVYYQFRSKEDIVLAVIRPVFDDVARLVESAEALPQKESRRDAAIAGLVALMVALRNASFPFRRDRQIDRIVARHPELRAVTDRFYGLLLGPDHDDATRVAMTVAITGIYCCATDPTLQNIAAPELGAAMLDCFKLCVARVSAPVPPAANPPTPAATQPDAALRDWAPCR